MSQIINENFFDQTLGAATIKIIDGLFTLLFLCIAMRVIKFIVNKALKRSSGNEKVLNTLRKLSVNVIHAIFIIMGTFTILEMLGINTASLVATAGIGGVAIGFGAQSLVKDVIAGFFILLEAQYFVGDVVQIEGIVGNVVDFGLRTTTLRDYKTGAIHIIPNGTITIVENRSRVDQLANLFLGIPIDKDPETVLGLLKNILGSYTDERVVEGPEVLGISAWKERYFTVFIKTTVTNGAMYSVQREMRKLITEELKNNGIEMYKPMIEIEAEGR